MQQYTVARSTNGFLLRGDGQDFQVWQDKETCSLYEGGKCLGKMVCSSENARIMRPDYNFLMDGVGGNLIQINDRTWLLSASAHDQWISYEITRSRRGWSVTTLDPRFSKNSHPLESFDDSPLVAHLRGDDFHIHRHLHISHQLLLCISLCKIISLSKVHSPLVRLRSLLKWPTALSV